MLKGIKILALFVFFIPDAAWAQDSISKEEPHYNDAVVPGAARTDLYLWKLKGKSVALVANQTSVIGNTHLVDSLRTLGIAIKCVFAPEHGFRGTAGAGEHVNSSVDGKTGIPLISLYGDHKKPTAKDLEGINIVVFDIQDVGARFYTYISTMHYVMEACAENNVEFMVMDRPNPNGFYVDGPVLQKGFESFVGMDPVPVVHGMTVAEYALMLNGESWLRNNVHCNLSYVPVANYKHADLCRIGVKPSPNLPDMKSIYLYPSLCLFEGTKVSVGRGTDKPFQLAGFPGSTVGDYAFTPQSNEGAKKPLYEGKSCRGYDLGLKYRGILAQKGLNLSWLYELYANDPDKDHFFNDFFDKLAGNAVLKQQIVSGKKTEDIRGSWKADLDRFKKIRKKYLLYLDFE